jgi:TolB-like protein
MPFANPNDDRDGQNLANGITEDLTTDLSLLPDLRVIPRSAAFAYKNRLADTKQINGELAVQYLVEGSVRRVGDQLRVNARLIDAETGTQLWAERFDRESGDLSAVQNEITSRIANTIGDELIAAEGDRPIEHADALGYILRGRAARLKPSSRETHAERIRLFEQALELDPQSVEAQSLLADELVERYLNRMTASPAADVARADELVGRVLAASPRYPFAHFVKGQILRAQKRYAEAISEFETVLASKPNAANALHALGECKLLTGRIDEVIPLEEHAVRLHPHGPLIGFISARIGLVQLLQSRTGEAILSFQRAASGASEFFLGHAGLAAAYALQGETGRAARELAEARRKSVGPDHLARVQAFFTAPPEIRALHEATFLAGLRKAGMPEQ